ncbi:hypothetical protein ACJIZ3_009089 [Penstemon smallii]|uniref:Uncharacterized protein n=1 Tax=Penstemon smallii TaxID=265156 RepID=A0ABD3TCQ5_9LAMI
MDKLPENFGALNDLKRAKKMFKNIDWEWDKYRKQFVKEDIDPDYEYVLKLLLQNAEVEEKNDVEVDTSPEDGPFLGNHKEYGSSSTLEAENNNVIEKSLKTLTKHPQVRMRPLTKIKKNAKK